MQIEAGKAALANLEESYQKEVWFVPYSADDENAMVAYAASLLTDRDLPPIDGGGSPLFWSWTYMPKIIEAIRQLEEWHEERAKHRRRKPSD